MYTKQIKKLAYNATRKVIELGFTQSNTDYRALRESIEVDMRDYIKIQIDNGVKPIHITMKAARAWLNGSLFDVVYS